MSDRDFPHICLSPSGPEDGDLEISVPGSDAFSGSGSPNFSDLFEQEADDDVRPATDLPASFVRATVFTEESKPWFKDPEYYQKLLGGEGESAKRVHSVLQAFIKAEDPQDKSMHRQRFIPAYWDFLASVAGKTGPGLSIPKQLLLRFGILLPTAIDQDQRQMLASTIARNTTGEPIHYVDEWLRQVASGRISSSAVDETKTAQKNAGVKIGAQIEKVRGKLDSQVMLINNLSAEMTQAERMLVDHAQNISRHGSGGDFDNVPGPYTDSQRNSFTEMGELMRRLSLANRKIQIAHGELQTIREQMASLQSKGDGSAEETGVDAKAAIEEAGTVRQMAKMCVGRQGNHFPMLSKSYFRGTIRDMGIRENVLNLLADVEYLDPGLFLRTFKQQTNRIVPNVVLIPCYGDAGICWEPFERFNRATSRGRLAIPMYPKDLRLAVISACADLRWQVAKEKAQHYWMEEGLTGWYYQWFSDAKIKGDVRDKFIEDYLLWIGKESEGTQKLERAVRDIFWRYMPFPQERRDQLKNRGFVYAELAKKDQNRAMSDGY